MKQLLIGILALSSISIAAPQLSSISSTAPKKMSAQELHDTMQALWMDHVVWTHDYIVAFFDRLKNADLIAKRLLKNQDDIGNAVALFYGKEAGTKLARLLKDHILIAVDVLKAAKANNKTALKHADDKWHQNAVDIATFLSNANPRNWPKNDLITMLNEHLALTTQEAVTYLKKEWQQSINLYDQVRTQIIKMANVLSDGIAKQFLNKPTTTNRSAR